MAKKQYPLNAKNMFGLSTMRWTVIAGSSLMTSAFMLYLTDYSGLANAALISTILLAFGRILDAVDDPLQGFIMDRSPITRIGKFKPFLLGGIALCSIAMIILFNMPSHMADWFKVAFLFIGYIMFEVGISFQPDVAIKATMTKDPKVRERLLIIPRIVEQFVAIPFSFFITIALAFGAIFNGDNHKGFSIATLLLVVPIAAIALVGAFCVKEGPYVDQSGEKAGLKDIVKMFRGNKPLWISQLAGFIGGCVFTFIIATVTYYIKWAYGPDHFGTNSAIWGAIILFGIITGTLLAPKLFKNTTPAMGSIICSLAQVIPLGIIFLLNLLGPIHLYLFLGLMFVSMIFSGMSYIPGSMVNMECMDYNIWKRGKGMEAMVQSVGNFVNKAQTAVAGLATGAVLVAINYDAKQYESEAFIAAGGTVPPGLLDGLTLVFCLIPVVLGVTAAVIMKFYPLKKEERDIMYQELRAENRE